MKLSAADISIGVTIYRRLDYVEQALRSAVEQTVPVKVILYDDGCLDLARLRLILEKFGDRVEYRRHPKTRGLFGNMNACIEQSPTPWVSVLHDDDALAPDFVERILAVAPEVEDAALFFGACTFIDAEGRPFFWAGQDEQMRWRMIPLLEFAAYNQFCFPGQLIHVESARKHGGLPQKSIYTGDWELWFNLTLERGAVQLGANLSFYRAHGGVDRGTNAAAKSGRKHPCCAMQVRRNLAKLRRRGIEARFDRRDWVASPSLPFRVQDLVLAAAHMPGWLLRYNVALSRLKQPRTRWLAAVDWAARLGGAGGVRLLSRAVLLAERCGMKMPQGF